MWKRRCPLIAFRVTHEHAEAPYPTRLLRVRRQRPSRRAAEQRNELTPFQLTQLHVLPLAEAYVTA
jgi:hypothetical protein